MQTSGDQRRENVRLYPRHCERSEAIHCHLAHGKMDCFAALAMTVGDAAHALLTLRRRQRHTSIAISSTTNPATIAPLINRPPGRSMVRDHSEGASPGRARRNATTLSPTVVPASE